MISFDHARTLRLEEWDARAKREGRAFPYGEVLNATYEVGQLLGTGGMGQVFEAVDRSLDRTVAIKAAWADQTESIRNEAKMLAAVRHPGALVVHGLGVHRGVEYMVMERIYGVNLHHHLAGRAHQRTPMALDEALDILVGVADCLSAVHRAQLAHHDVKAANIMLTPGNRVVLMDFGVARPECEPPPRRGAGTLPYMAPESFFGTIRKGSGYLTDVYALGALAHEVITGHLPYEGDSESIIRQHVDAPVPHLRETRREIPEDLDTLVHSLLAKDPEDRPQCMEVIEHELRAMRDRARRSLAPRTDRFSVLIIDDDSALVRTLGRLVREIEPDAVVRTACDAEMGVALVREHPPDVIVSDLHMPRMNGVELCMWLVGTHLSEQCHIVTMSANATDEDRRLLRTLGVTAFVEKGPDFDEAMRVVLEKLRS